MDTDYMRDNIATDRTTADMQMAIVKKLREIEADFLTDKQMHGIYELDKLIRELEDDALTTYRKLEVLRGETK